jgi:hypothetical protein
LQRAPLKGVFEEEEKKEASRPLKIDSDLIYNWHAK